ncbi:hypothetical protein JD969_02255 [Planctomycetota bacterium]|nr:hypothetical protein JD969_02255 [Planctomycetota bacterium]
MCSQTYGAVDFQSDLWVSRAEYDGNVLAVGTKVRGVGPAENLSSTVLYLYCGLVPANRGVEVVEQIASRSVSWCYFDITYDDVQNVIAINYHNMAGDDLARVNIIKNALETEPYIDADIKRFLKIFITQETDEVGQYVKQIHLADAQEEVDIHDIGDSLPTDYSSPEDVNEQLANLVETIQAATDEIRFYIAVTAIATSFVAGLSLFRITVLGKNQRTTW